MDNVLKWGRIGGGGGCDGCAAAACVDGNVCMGVAAVGVVEVVADVPVVVVVVIVVGGGSCDVAVGAVVIVVSVVCCV